MLSLGPCPQRVCIQGSLAHHTQTDSDMLIEGHRAYEREGATSIGFLDINEVQVSNGVG